MLRRLPAPLTKAQIFKATMLRMRSGLYRGTVVTFKNYGLGDDDLKELLNNGADLTAIDVSNTPGVATPNQFSAIMLDQLDKLTKFNAAHTGATSLLAKKCSALEEVEINNCDLVSLNISGSGELKRVNAADNPRLTEVVILIAYSLAFLILTNCPVKFLGLLVASWDAKISLNSSTLEPASLADILHRKTIENTITDLDPEPRTVATPTKAELTVYLKKLLAEYHRTMHRELFVECAGNYVQAVVLQLCTDLGTTQPGNRSVKLPIELAKSIASYDSLTPYTERFDVCLSLIQRNLHHLHGANFEHVLKQHRKDIISLYLHKLAASKTLSAIIDQRAQKFKPSPRQATALVVAQVPRPLTFGYALLAPVSALRRVVTAATGKRNKTTAKRVTFA